MDAQDVLALGLGVTPPWRLVEQRLDTNRPETLRCSKPSARRWRRSKNIPSAFSNVERQSTATPAWKPRMEAMNGLFQAARARARDYRNTETFITMIYLIAARLEDVIKSTSNVEEQESIEKAVGITSSLLSWPRILVRSFFGYVAARDRPVDGTCHRGRMVPVIGTAGLTGSKNSNVGNDRPSEGRLLAPLSQLIGNGL